MPEALLTGTFRGVTLPHDSATCQTLADMCRERTSGQIDSAGEHLCVVAQAGQSSMHALGCTHEQTVVYSHGEHIPLSVRNAAVVAFWLPYLFVVDFDKLSRSEAKACWLPRADTSLGGYRVCRKHT